MKFGNLCDRFLIQSIWFGKPPQKALGIQPEFHSSPPSNAVKISFGKGSLKSSSGKTNLPRSCSKLARRLDKVQNGTNFVIGMPPFEIMIYSPYSTSDNSSEKLVLA